MFKVIKKQIRKNLKTEFYIPSEEYKVYLNDTYIKTKKLLESIKTESEDKLILITETAWSSEETFREFMSDSYCFDNFLLPSQNHNEQNNIIVETAYNENNFVMLQPAWKQYDPFTYFSNLNIPSDWSTLEDFVDWYIETKMPIMIPWNAEVIKSDDAVAVCIFRKNNYQVELYLEYPGMFIRKHAHPRMEVITMDLGGGGFWPKNSLGLSNVWGRASSKLLPGEFHGGDSSTLASKGFVTLAFQRWENQDEMSSAAVQWKGELQGKVQKNLILSNKTDANINDNWADVS